MASGLAPFPAFIETGAIPHCDICGEKYPHYYLKDSIWNSVYGSVYKGGWICLECFEKKLGRKLQEEDISMMWFNVFEIHKKSSWIDNKLLNIKTKKITFFAILKLLYNVDVMGKHKLDFLKYENGLWFMNGLI